MKKSLVIVLALCLMCASVAYAADQGSAGKSAKNFWQRLFNYPAKVTDNSASVIAETGKKGTAVVTKEVSTVGQVTSGEFDKAKDLVVEPVKGTAQTAVDAVKDTANIPVKSAQETEPK